MPDETDLDLPELAGAETVGRIAVTQLDWWNAHSGAFSEAVAVAEWAELHVEHRTVGPVIEERPVQRLTRTVEEAAVVLGILRATAFDAVSRGEIPCVRQAHPHPQGRPGAVAGRGRAAATETNGHMPQ